MKRATEPSKFNFNSLSARNIYLSLVLNEDLNLNVDLLDLNSQMTEKQLLDKLSLSYSYLYSILDTDKLIVRLNILVADSDRETYFQSRLSQIKKDFLHRENLTDCIIKVVNLNIGKSLFGGMTIIR